MTCNFALIEVNLAINQCQDWFMHNRKDCKWNICKSLEYTYKLFFLCWRRTRNCIMYSDINFYKEIKYLAYQKGLKIFLGLIPLYAINCQPKRHNLHIKGLCQNEGYFEIYQLTPKFLSVNIDKILHLWCCSNEPCE
jgi:hypothetical protein